MRLTLASQAPAAEDAVERRGTGRPLRLSLLVLLLAWAVRSFLFAPFSIPSGSMLPALYVGDYVVVAKWPYGYSRHSFLFGLPAFQGRIFADLPQRGDIVVFRAPGSGINYVKRVIGVPGDRVEMRGGMLVLNGQAIPREADGFAAVPVSPNSPCRVASGATPRTSSGQCLYPRYTERLPAGRAYGVIDQVENPRADDMAALTVPQGQLFLLGDNRDDSFDSRYSPAEGGIGLVPLENLIGRAAMIFWSTDGSAEYWKPWTWFSGLRTDRVGKTLGEPAR